MKTTRFLPFLLLAGWILASAGCAAQNSVPPTGPAKTVLFSAKQSSPCSTASCPNLVITQAGQPARLNLSAQGIQAAAPLARPNPPAQNAHWVVDTGRPSPDGQWAAYTSTAGESGGPVLLQNLQTGEWSDLIAAVNAHLPQGAAPLRESDWWDLIGWFPDSARLMIGPTDLSQVVVIDRTTFAAQQIRFPGGGRGGRLFMDLARDGSRFLFVGDDSSGSSQVLASVDLTTGQQTDLLKVPYEQGVLYNPRFSPDQTSVAYVVQKGQPESGLTYAIQLLPTGQGQPKALVEGNLGLTIPTWSPDGKSIAFTRRAADGPYRVIPEKTPVTSAENVWVVSVADGKQRQVTSLEGQARSPAWASDSQTLAFITQDGQVGIASLAQPGQTWQAAGPSTTPELTSVFFLP